MDQKHAPFLLEDNSENTNKDLCERFNKKLILSLANKIYYWLKTEDIFLHPTLISTSNNETGRKPTQTDVWLTGLCYGIWSHTGGVCNNFNTKKRLSIKHAQKLDQLHESWMNLSRFNHNFHWSQFTILTVFMLWLQLGRTVVFIHRWIHGICGI